MFAHRWQQQLVVKQRPCIGIGLGYPGINPNTGRVTDQWVAARRTVRAHHAGAEAWGEAAVVEANLDCVIDHTGVVELATPSCRFVTDQDYSALVSLTQYFCL